MNRKRKFDSVLDECLERIMLGEDVQACLVRYPEFAAELEPLLKTISDTKNAMDIKPRPEFRQRAAYEFQAAIRDMPVKGSGGIFKWQLRWVMPVAIVLAVLMAGSGTVFAANNSLPGEPLYQVKLATETVQLALTPSDLGKAELYAKFADERVDEIVKLANKGEAKQIETATDRMNSQLVAMANLTGNAAVASGETSSATLSAQTTGTESVKAQASNAPVITPAAIPAPQPASSTPIPASGSALKTPVPAPATTPNVPIPAPVTTPSTTMTVTTAGPPPVAIATAPTPATVTTTVPTPAPDVTPTPPIPTPATETEPESGPPPEQVTIPTTSEDTGVVQEPAPALVEPPPQASANKTRSSPFAKTAPQFNKADSSVPETVTSGEGQVNGELHAPVGNNKNAERMEKLRKILSRRVMEHLQKLQEELEKAPDNLKPALERAIEVIINGYENNLSNLK